jgi:alkylation response protein AidB-like acyl-CoA dehydrogenase
VGARYYSDYLYTLAVTDPEVPRHQNISAFMIPSNSSGLTITHLDLIAGGGKRMIYFEDVRVPRENLIGGEAGRGKGWWVAQTTLELEHGGSGRVTRDPLIDKFIAYCRNTRRNGAPISSDPRIKQILTEIYIQSHVGRLMGTRNYWMRTSGKRFSYEGSQFSLWGKTFAPWLAKQVREVLGPYASVNDPALGSILDEIENHQRQSLATHPGGTPEIQKVIMARGIGVSRTPQRSAESGRSAAGAPTAGSGH